MSIDLNPNYPIIKRFAEDLNINGKAPRTGQSYCRALRKFMEFLVHSPEEATEDQLRNYLLHISETKKWKPSTINVAQQAIKLFFRIACPRECVNSDQELSHFSGLAGVADG